MPVKLKRIYEEADKQDGYRVLVDNVWPRGVSKAKAELDDWAKEVPPSKSLRKWFHHDEEKFDSFAGYYEEELQNDEDAQRKIKELADKAVSETVTLLFAARNETHNHAVLLKQWIEEKR
ncbi:DUF488 domain-containing protein [Salibacterium qingdaonense]|uniref:Uncharacterized conserved protein YeaO, DUF488 family n=1 Tax=Salibacterium qingdaonense TaxID=266892 RepID=A0A1I4PV93_9BACI|nr:DUF488 family protein [Salibacterium qingdaonense]SFM31729.1 Uncharacterized conserved protein YeaO, DUF488 family [Salibacterium qingdaonense]